MGYNKDNGVPQEGTHLDGFFILCPWNKEDRESMIYADQFGWRQWGTLFGTTRG
jgi:hypothetical protein